MRTLVRALWVVLLVGLTGAVAWFAPPPAVTDELPVMAAAVPAAATTLGCVGPLRLPTELEPGSDVGYDPEFDPSPDGSTTHFAAVTAAVGSGGAGTVTLRPVGATDLLGRLQDVGVLTPQLVPTSIALRGEPVAADPAWVGGSVLTHTPSGDLRGLAAATCQHPASESWLVGGGTELGSSARLLLVNPGATVASVGVRLWGASGPVTVAGAHEYLVPAGREVTVLLEGIAAEQRRLVVQVVAAGGQVAAYLQDSRLDGLVPLGVDYVVAGQPPAERQTVVGIEVLDRSADPVPSGVDTGGAEPDDAGVEPGDAEPADVTGTGPELEGDGVGWTWGPDPVLRMLSPEQPAVVDLTFLGADGEYELPGTRGLQLAAGEVLDVPLDGLPPGHYAVVVVADVPVVAGAMLTSAVSPQGEQDRVWLPSLVPSPGPLAVPEGAVGTLVLAAERPTAVTLELLEGGSRTERVVEVAGAVALPLSEMGDPGGIVVRTSGVAWAVTLSDGQGVAALTPVPPRSAQPLVHVQVR